MKKSFILLLSVFTLFCLVSCGSTPEEESTTNPEPQAPAEEIVEEEVLSTEEENSLIELITAARNRAIEAGAEEKAPEKLQEIDAKFDAAKNDKNILKAEGNAIADMYNALADELSALSAEDAQAALEAEVRETVAKAGELYELIEEKGLDVYAPENFARGCDSFNLLEKAYEEGRPLTAADLENAKTAYSEFNKVKIAGFKTIAKQERGNAYTEKKNADSVKAGVSQKERYKEAAENFKKADALYAMQNPEKAIEYYVTAKESFAALYTEVADKRAAAQAAIEAAKQTVAASAEYANEADKTSPITGENVAGIEDEDAVLLEEDNYEDPEDAEIEIAETFEKEVINTVEDVVTEATTVEVGEK